MVPSRNLSGNTR
ncbi:hypothetical protein ECEC1849_0823, partial [Escherichia coli EC1849]